MLAASAYAQEAEPALSAPCVVTAPVKAAGVAPGPFETGSELDQDPLGPESGTDTAHASEPVPLSLSIGSPNAGLLLNPVAMPSGPLWKIRNPSESYATAETVGFLRTAIEAVEARFPGSPRVVIGDISRADGGRLNRHASHQSGRDADIGYYDRRSEPADLRSADARTLDVPRTWALVRAFVTHTDVERIFIDRSLQRLILSHALATGEDRDWLDDLFGRRGAGQGAIVQHERRHRDHMHVRFFNPAAQDCGRLAYPRLVESGRLPAPSLWHRARAGETLSGLAQRYGVSSAAIRSANGLSNSFLRAGKRYAIPVLRTLSEGAAQVVPPRRLPPNGLAAAAESAAAEDLSALREPPSR